MRNRHHYPAEWYDTIRPRILKRDNYKCRECRIDHRVHVAVNTKGDRIIIDKDEITDYLTSGYKCYRIYLQVAHLDNNKGNNDDSNLKTLCVKCHSRLDKEWKKILRMSNTQWRQKNILQEISEVTNNIRSVNTHARPCPPQEPHARKVSFGTPHSL